MFHGLRQMQFAHVRGPLFKAGTGGINTLLLRFASLFPCQVYDYVEIINIYLMSNFIAQVADIISNKLEN